MAIPDILREVTWYTEEIRARERELVEARERVRSLEDRIRTDQSQLEKFTRQLADAEAAERNRPVMEL